MSDILEDLTNEDFDEDDENADYFNTSSVSSGVGEGGSHIGQHTQLNSKQLSSTVYKTLSSGAGGKPMSSMTYEDDKRAQTLNCKAF